MLDDYGGYISIGSSGFCQRRSDDYKQRPVHRAYRQSVYEEILPVLKRMRTEKHSDTTLEELSRRIPGTSCLSFEQTDKQLEESFAQIKKCLAWG